MTIRVALACLLTAASAMAQPAALAAPPESVRALLQLAQSEAADAHREAALESLRRARALAPNSEQVLSAFAQVALAARLLAPAIATLESLTRMCPTVAQYYHLLGVALMAAGDIPAAVPALQQADRLEADRPSTLLALALALNSRKQYADAKLAALKSVQLEPENSDAVAALAEAEAGVGDSRSAEEHVRHVLARDASHAAANLVSGILLMRQERYAEAREALETAAAADSGSAAAHYQLSLAYARLGDLARSQQEVEIYQQKLRETEERIKALRSGAAGEKRR
jgi:cytochrome c-type biogenesis protein CcmH/NrfG